MCYVASLTPVAQQKVWPGLLERYCKVRAHASRTASGAVKLARQDVAAACVPLALEAAREEWHCCREMLLACLCSLDWGEAVPSVGMHAALKEHIRRVAHCIEFCIPSESEQAECKD